MKDLVIVNKNRFKVFVLSMLILSASFFTLCFGLFESYKAYGAEENQNIEYTVRKGDTVWMLAKNRADMENRDVRDLVREIYILNNLEGSTIKPGQTILIPKF